MKERAIGNILVTGGSGFIGSAFIRNLLKPKSEFSGLCVNFDCLTYAGNQANLISIKDDPRYRFVYGDILDPRLVKKTIRENQVDTIIHLAAESHVDRSILNPQSFIQTNVIGTFHLLEAVRESPQIHFHHVSTDEVYGCLGDTGFFTEESPYRPNSPYSASKAASDHLVRSYSRTYEISTCISNCSNNYGPFQFPEKLIPLIILNCLRGRPLPIYGDGKNVRDWLYVDDHAECLRLLLKKGRSGEVYNIGGEQERKNIDLVNEIIHIVSDIKNIPLSELQSLITYVKDRPAHDWRYAIDCSKVKEEIGWRPSSSLSGKLRDTVEWYLNNEDWVKDVESGAYLNWIHTNYRMP